MPKADARTLSDETLKQIIEQAKQATQGRVEIHDTQGDRILRWLRFGCDEFTYAYEVHAESIALDDLRYFCSVSPFVGQQMAEEILRLREAISAWCAAKRVYDAGADASVDEALRQSAALAACDDRLFDLGREADRLASSGLI